MNNISNMRTYKLKRYEAKMNSITAYKAELSIKAVEYIDQDKFTHIAEKVTKMHRTHVDELTHAFNGAVKQLVTSPSGLVALYFITKDLISTMSESDDERVVVMAQRLCKHMDIKKTELLTFIDVCILEEVLSDIRFYKNSISELWDNQC